MLPASRGNLSARPTRKEPAVGPECASMPGDEGGQSTEKDLPAQAGGPCGAGVVAAAHAGPGEPAQPRAGEPS
ncbi:hypothetical protein GCM10009535_57330 [Streptomyces thermocarboxydovorans]|uniref:Uncharacterized protein n=1 Tax=Streptomyces thermocarboxydovorans TaxID=59298 RepID=A0ABP3T5R7_9ACTN